MAKQPTPPEAEEFIEAAWQNETDTINELAGKYPYLVDPTNRYLLEALHTACNSCQFEAATLLVEKYKADVNAILDKERGMTALHEAMNSGDTRIAKMLIKNGADVNAVDQSREGFTDGWTPLDYAKKDAEMTKFLIAHGAQGPKP